MLCYNVESVDRNTFCWTIITSTNVPIIIIMCQVKVFILQKGEIFISISECSWLILLAQLKLMTGTDFQTIVREKDYCEIQVILNWWLIKFSVRVFWNIPFSKATNHDFVFWNNDVKHVPDSPDRNSFKSHMKFVASVS
jgi:hypothetical protein